MFRRRVFRRPPVKFGVAGVIVVAVAAPAWAIKVVAYNLLNYPGSSAVQRDPHFRTILTDLQPDIVMAQEIQNGGAANAFLINVLNQVNPGGWAQHIYYDCGDTDQSLFYRIASISTAGVGSDLATTINTTPRLSPRWKVRLKDYNLPENSFYIYGCHLKASDTTADANERKAAADLIRANANDFPAGTKFIVAGDMNFYRMSTEPGYTSFTGSQVNNNGRVVDVLNPSLVLQEWHNNSAYRFIHTQSPRTTNPSYSTDGTLGGLDDRFDFIFISTALNATSGLSYVAGTYRTVGQDGNRFNGAVNSPLPNGDVSNDVANALWGAADHLPVLIQLRAPANARVLPAALAFGSVLVNAGATQMLTVSNIAPPPGETLTYSYTSSPPGYFTAPGGTLARAAGVSAADSISMDTSTPGAKSLSPALTITTNSLETPTIQVAATGTVLNHAVPSVDPSTQVLSGLIDFGTHPVGEFDLEVSNIYNLGYTPGGFQARAELYFYDVAGPDADRFIVFDVTPPLVENFPSFAYVFFDDTGATPGTYSATLTIYVADELSLPGAIDLGPITFDMTAGIPGLKGDFNLNGVVDCADVPPMIAVLLNPGAATPQQRDIADMNSDTLNNGRDIQPFINALVCP